MLWKKRDDHSGQKQNQFYFTLEQILRFHEFLTDYNITTITERTSCESEAS